MAIEDDMAANFGGPGPEDIANGAAILSSALVREAIMLTKAAKAIADLNDANASHSYGIAEARAKIALHASRVIIDGDRIGEQVWRLRSVAEYLEVYIPVVTATIRAAALQTKTDDAAARIAASTLAADLCARLNQDR